MQSKTQKRKSALVRREANLRHWEKSLDNTKSEKKQELFKKKIEIAKFDIKNINKKLSKIKYEE